MATKIEKLTEAQIAAIPKYVAKWVDIGLSTTPMDREKAIAAVKNLYASSNLKQPEKFIFVNGPDEGYMYFKAHGGKTIQSFMDGIIYGQHEAHQMAFYDYFINEIKRDGVEDIEPLIRTAETCGWFFCGEDTVIMMEKTAQVKLDEQNRLHCENGPAVAYKDDFKAYCWHGVTVPDEWIENKASLTPAIALSQTNIELRRCACEILGWVHILDSLKAKVIDKDEDPMVGTLYEVNIPDIGKERFLKVLCGTGRTFAIPVPKNMKTALEANAWTYDVEPEEIRNLEVRT